MIRLVLFLLAVIVLAGCGVRGDRGHVIGVQDRPTAEYADPPGMVYIPMGSFTMGPSDEDIAYTQNATSRTVSLPAFYMDETEITNNQYRQFVHWVRDSIARQMLYEWDPATFDDYILDIDDEFGNPIDNPPYYNHDARIRWDDDEVLQALIDLGLYRLDEGERFFRRREIDVDRLVYRYYTIDLREAARYTPHERRELGITRRDFITEHDTHIYPDTLVWIRDFTYAYNEPYAKMYFWHPTFDHYPVVGINWEQARAFNVWRTQYLNSYLAGRDRPFAMDFELPSEAQWEYAARGGLELSPYPWGGPYTRDEDGCFLANFKPLRGDYTATGAMYTTIAGFYPPNDYGLYDMAGNVSEWTRNAYDESFYYFGTDMSPDFQHEFDPATDHISMSRKVVRGGSWKDIGYFLQVSTRTYEYQDTAKSYIGFRSVQSYPGVSREAGRAASNVW